MENLFVNTEIFNDERDYVVGGFYHDEKTQINNLREDLRGIVKTRVIKFITDFIKEEQAHYLKRLKHNQTVDTTHADQLIIETIQEFLGVTPENADLHNLVDAIMESEQMVSWLADKKNKIDKEVSSNKTQQSISTSKVTIKFDIESAEIQMSEASLVTLLEELSMINN